MASRRRLLASALALPLAGCGFQLRQPPEFAFKTIYVAMPATSPMGLELRRNLTGTGRVEVITDPILGQKADVLLEPTTDQRERVVVGRTSSGEVRELQLRLRFRFRLRTPQGTQLIPETEILQQRELSFNESVILAKDAEEAMLYRNMQSDIVQQILRRLAAVKTI
ncbi:LPS-assembly lipoprotein LptE [Pseudorhodoferax sp.]|uniref:LPS-assembly lipoprotein LptE n=1 Tax=Pseudorhodoferax sp. TaxID=1993553 RepID=UPI002DD63764|nr:LPS assembly lipoprotein LptE [Pseudorhodoferax sp.]